MINFPRQGVVHLCSPKRGLHTWDTSFNCFLSWCTKIPLFVVFMFKILENFINKKFSKKSKILATHCVLAHYVSMAFSRTCRWWNSPKFLSWMTTNNGLFVHQLIKLVIFVRKPLLGEQKWRTPLLCKISHFRKFSVFLHFKNQNNPYKPKISTDLWNWGPI